MTEVYGYKGNKSKAEVPLKADADQDMQNLRNDVYGRLNTLLPDKIWIDDPSKSSIFIMSGVTNQYMGIGGGNPDAPYTWCSLGNDVGGTNKIVWKNFNDRPLISRVNFSYANADIKTKYYYPDPYDSTTSTIKIMNYISDNFISLFSPTVTNIVHASDKVSCTLRIWFFINNSPGYFYVISGNPGLANYFDVDIIDGQITQFKNINVHIPSSAGYPTANNMGDSWTVTATIYKAEVF